MREETQEFRREESSEQRKQARISMAQLGNREKNRADLRWQEI